MTKLTDSASKTPNKNKLFNLNLPLLMSTNCIEVKKVHLKRCVMERLLSQRTGTLKQVIFFGKTLSNHILKLLLNVIIDSFSKTLRVVSVK